MPAGRKSKLTTETFAEAIALAETGLTVIEIAARMKVGEKTIYRWREASPEFKAALTAAKDIADDKVELSLFQKAVGGDVAAIIFWLKNRRRGQWSNRDQLELMGENGGPLVIGWEPDASK